MWLLFKTDFPINIDELPITIVRSNGEQIAISFWDYQYYDFLHEYLELDHIKLVTEDKATPFKLVYIPHHALFATQL